MRSEELRNSILNAREQRWETLSRLTGSYRDGCVITIVCNTAGEEKDSPAMRRLIACAEERMAKDADALTIGAYGDAAGYIVFMHSPLDAKSAKSAAVALETEHERNRLLDIDIYNTDGQAADRASMGIPPRRCLLCNEPAADCIRTQRHAYPDIIAETHRLLTGFQESC